jgi:hypothetical protein
MGEYTIFDAAIPPLRPPSLCAGVLGYIGGRADHVWTPQQWQPFRDMRQFPGWVADLSADPEADADAAVAAALRLGWAADEPGDQRRAIILDMETSTDAAWYARAAVRVGVRGFVPVAYGSESTVLQCAASDVLAAAWDDVPDLLPGQTIHGHQYQAQVPIGGTFVDFSIIDEWLYQRGGVGPRRQ